MKRVLKLSPIPVQSKFSCLSNLQLLWLSNIISRLCRLWIRMTKPQLEVWNCRHKLKRDRRITSKNVASSLYLSIVELLKFIENDWMSMKYSSTSQKQSYIWWKEFDSSKQISKGSKEQVYLITHPQCWSLNSKWPSY